MGWEIFIPLVLQYGLPLAEKLWAKWGSKEPVTQADIDALKELAARTPKSQVMEALIRNGIDPNSPQGKTLLDLVQ